MKLISEAHSNGRYRHAYQNALIAKAKLDQFKQLMAAS